MRQQESLISIMVEVGIAIHGGGNPYQRLRIAKNQTPIGSSHRRVLECLLKSDKTYLLSAIAALPVSKL